MSDNDHDTRERRLRKAGITFGVLVLIVFVALLWSSSRPSAPALVEPNASQHNHNDLHDDLSTPADVGASRSSDAVRVAGPSANTQPTTGSLVIQLVGSKKKQARAAAAVYVHPLVASGVDELTSWQTSDAHGRVSWRDLAPGSWVVGDPDGGVHGVRVAVGLETQLTIELVEGASLRGRVIDTAGAPVTGARVWTSKEVVLTPPLSVVRTDESGYFTIPDTGAARFIGAIAAGFVPTPCTPIPRVGNDGATCTIELVLRSPSARIVCVVKSMDGRPVVDAWVRAATVPGLVELVGGEARVPVTNAVERTDGAGHCEFTSIPVGAVSVEVRAPGFARALRAATLAEHESQMIEVVLVSELQVRGRVHTVDGVPIAGALIRRGEFRYEDPRNNGAPLATSASDGTFELRGIEPGATQLCAFHASGARQCETFSWKIGDQPFWDVVLEASGHLRGRIVDASGVPMPHMPIVVHAEGGDPELFSSMLSAVDGTFECSVLASATFVVEVRDPNAEGSTLAAREHVRIDEGIVEIVLSDEMVPSGWIEGRIVEAEGRAAAGIGVFVESSRDETRLDSTTDEQGRFRIGPLAKGTWQLSANSGAGFAEPLGNFDVSAHAVHDIALVSLSRRGNLLFTVDASAGRKDIVFSIVASDGRLLYARPIVAKEVGTQVRIDRMPVGRWRCVASAGASRGEPLEVEVRADTDAYVRVSLRD